MNDINAALDYYLLGLWERSPTEDAFFNLLELGQPALARLMIEAAKAEHRQIRAFLVSVIWQIRDPAAIGFLGAALTDPDPQVWKEALDGLVALGGPAAIDWVNRTLEQIRQGNLRNGLSEDWLQEALEQITARAQIPRDARAPRIASPNAFFSHASRIDRDHAWRESAEWLEVRRVERQ